jgi:hypothetical protein
VLATRDGRATPIDDSAAPILDAEGKVLGVVLCSGMLPKGGTWSGGKKSG